MISYVIPPWTSHILDGHHILSFNDEPIVKCTTTDALTPFHDYLNAQLPILRKLGGESHSASVITRQKIGGYNELISEVKTLSEVGACAFCLDTFVGSQKKRFGVLLDAFSKKHADSPIPAE